MIPLNIQPPIPVILFEPITISPKIINSIENNPFLTVHDFVFFDINKTINVVKPADTRNPPRLFSVLKNGTLDAPLNRFGHSGDRLGCKVFVIIKTPERPIPINMPSSKPGFSLFFFCSFI